MGTDAGEHDTRGGTVEMASRTVQPMSGGQVKDLSASLIQGIDPKWSGEVAQTWIGHKSNLHAGLDLLIRGGLDVIPIIDGIVNGVISMDLILAQMEPTAPYKFIDNLYVIGPAEIETAFRAENGSDPLGLGEKWVPRDIPMVINTPKGDVAITPDLMRKLAKFCKNDKQWKTTPILFLAPPEVGGKPTTILNMVTWWGSLHDKNFPGRIRQEIYHTRHKTRQGKTPFDIVDASPLQQKAKWCNIPATERWAWYIGYTSTPSWTYDSRQESPVVYSAHQFHDFAIRKGYAPQQIVRRLFMATIGLLSCNMPTYGEVLSTQENTEVDWAEIRYWSNEGWRSWEDLPPVGIELNLDPTRGNTAGCAIEGIPLEILD